MIPSISKKTLVIVVGFILGVIALIVIAISVSSSPQSTIKLSPAYATNIAFPYQLNANEINFFTGTTFATYNNATHSTKTLTPQYSLPRLINEVEWSQNAVLFQATGYSDVDQLYPELVRQSLTPNASYWWLVNLKTGIITLVGSASTHYSVSSVVWINNTTFITAEQPEEGDGQSLTAYSLDGKASAVGTIPVDAILVGGNTTKPVYTIAANGTNDVITYDPKTGTGKKTFTNILRVLAGNPDGSVVAIRKGSGKYDPEALTGDLVYYNAATKKIKTLTTNFRGNAQWVAPLTSWLASGTGTNGGQAFAIAGTKVTSYAVEASSTDKKFQELTAVGFSDQDLLLTTPGNELMAAAKKPLNGPDLPSLTSFKNDHDTATYSIVYIADQDQYSIYIKQAPYEAGRQAVLSYIKQQGLDANQLKLKWYAYDNVDTGFYLPATAVPIDDPIPVAPDTIDDGD